MPYQTGTATSSSDLQTTIEVFATSNGWTLTNGVLSKDGCHIKLDGSSATQLYAEIGLGDDGAGNLTDKCAYNCYLRSGLMTYRNVGDDAYTLTYPATYHLFSFDSPAHIFVTVNFNVAHCQHMIFGNIKKYGTYTGGQSLWASHQPRNSSSLVYYPSGFAWVGGDSSGRGSHGYYFFGSVPGSIYPCSPSGFVYCDLDGTTWKTNRVNGTGYAAGYGSTTAAGLSRPYLNKFNSINLQPVLSTPVFVTDRPSSLKSVIGVNPHMRYLRVDNYLPGDIISVGTQDFMVFPFNYEPFAPIGFAVKYDGP